MPPHKTLLRALWPILLLPVFFACAVGPDYQRPVIKAPASYKEDASKWTESAPGLIDQGRWWAMYKDPDLDKMMALVELANQNIVAAEARIRQAQAQTREARASFFPSLDLSGRLDRSNTFQDDAIQNTYQAMGTMTWELDLWGGVRRAVEASQAQARSTVADAAAVRLSMQAELAQNYFQLRTLDQQLTLQERTLVIYEKALELTSNKYQAGVVTRIDVAQAETQLESARVSAAELTLQRRQLEHALAILMGLAPADFSLPRAAFTASLPELPPGLPSQLLERRPDIASAEQLVIQANANIGVARSAWFPSFSFSASAGLQHSFIGDWFGAPAQMWSLGPLSAAWNIFEAGATLARNEQALAAWEESVANYRQTVLTAFGEVEDCLAGTVLLAEQSRVQALATRSAREAESLAMNQYMAGTVDYLNVVSAQTTALSNAMNSEELKGRELINSVLLVKALGGGWSQDQL